MAVTRFHRMLEEKVNATMEEWGKSIICGQIKDYAEYRDACGYIRGLADALRLCDDIERDLDS